MADFLLVHDAGHGAWNWGRVWGYLTAPVEHPPKLFARGAVGKVVAFDLPGHGTNLNGPAATKSLDDFVVGVVAEARSQGLRDLVLVGHGASAPVVLQAAANLEQPPRRIVLFAGIIPDDGKSSLEMLPRRVRLPFKMMARLNSVARKEFRLPKAVITSAYCNDMDPFDVIQIVGRFSPLPLRMIQTRVRRSEFTSVCPVTYVPLWRDRLIPSDSQRRMAERLPGVEIARDLDACHEAMIECPAQVADILLRNA